MGSDGVAPLPAGDLSTCDSEPIHIPGYIQPHGVLFSVREHDLLIEQASANTERHLGIAPKSLLGRPLADALGGTLPDALTAALAVGDPRNASPIEIVLPGAAEPRTFDLIAHRHEGRLIVELENGRAAGIPPLHIEPDRLVRVTLARLQGELCLKDFCQAAAREVRANTGFDRVMVYRFDPDWNGEVFAEEKRDDLEPFLGLHYPASDIPAQARRLYTLNWVRHIPDITYEASPLVPATARPLDLSFSVLRSVSPIHVEYLKNMGVRASLSISILKGGRLWGLIACHHYAPRFIPYRLRAACEALGVLMSLQLSTQLDSEELRCRVEAQVRQSRLANALVADADLEAAILSRPDDYLDLVSAQGGAVAHAGRLTLVGKTPTADQVQSILDWFRASGRDGVVMTHALPSEFPEAEAFRERASGLLATALSADRSDCLLWFRAEEIETVDWGGDPNDKRVVVGPNGPRLSPRGSFALWKEQRRGRSRFWTACERDAAVELRDGILAALARRASELQTEARRKDEFLALLGHELRNPIAPIRNALQVLRLRPDDPRTAAWACEVGERQTNHLIRMIDDLADVARVSRGKLRLQVAPVDLAAIVRHAVDDHRPALEARGLTLDLHLPRDPVWIEGDATRLTQVVGNLLTNAGKFTDHGGRITITLDLEPDHATLTVADTGIGIDAEALSRVFDPFEQAERSLSRSREGLGLGLALVKGVVALHGGDSWARSEGLGRGAEFGFTIPHGPTATSPR